jgi:hypothetical protein
MFESTALVASLKPVFLAVIACALAYIAVALDRWRLLRLVPAAVGGAAPSINLAMAIRIAAVGIAMAGSLSGLAYSGVEGDLDQAALVLAFEGLLMMALIAIATVVADVVVVPEIPNTEAIRNGNVSVSVVEGSVLIATGQIAAASFGSASMTGIGSGLISALVFFALGQAILCLIAYAIRKLSTVDVIHTLEKGELTLAIVFAAKLFAAGYVMSSIIAGPSVGLLEDLMMFAKNGLIAALMFGVAYYSGLRIFGLTESSAAVMVATNDMPRAIRTAGLVMVAAFIASVSM